MNAIKRLYCRAYQLAFRAALPVLPYRQPRLLDHLAGIAPLLEQKQISSVLLVADAGVRSLGLTAGLEDSLARAQIACAVYEQRTPNPTIDNVEDALRVYLSSGARAIVAVGGGSAMDCAKVVGARVARPRKRVQQMRGLLRVGLCIVFSALMGSIGIWCSWPVGWTLGTALGVFFTLRYLRSVRA